MSYELTVLPQDFGCGFNPRRAKIENDGKILNVLCQYNDEPAHDCPHLFKDQNMSELNVQVQSK